MLEYPEAGPRYRRNWRTEADSTLSLPLPISCLGGYDLSGLERARLLRDMPVQIGDVNC